MFWIVEVPMWLLVKTPTTGRETIKALLAQRDFDPSIEKEMISRALEFEEGIKEGRIYSVDETDAKLNKRLGK